MPGKPAQCLSYRKILLNLVHIGHAGSTLSRQQISINHQISRFNVVASGARARASRMPLEAASVWETAEGGQSERGTTRRGQRVQNTSHRPTLSTLNPMQREDPATESRVHRTLELPISCRDASRSAIAESAKRQRHLPAVGIGVALAQARRVANTCNHCVKSRRRRRGCFGTSKQ